MSNRKKQVRRLVSVNAAAEYVDVHPMTLRRWIAAGRVTAYRMGPRLLKVDLNELDAMLTPIPTAATGTRSGGRDVA